MISDRGTTWFAAGTRQMHSVYPPFEITFYCRGAIIPVKYTYVGRTLIIPFPATILSVITVATHQESPSVLSFRLRSYKKKKITWHTDDHRGNSVTRNKHAYINKKLISPAVSFRTTSTTRLLRRLVAFKAKYYQHFITNKRVDNRALIQYTALKIVKYKAFSLR